MAVKINLFNKTSRMNDTKQVENWYTIVIYMCITIRPSCSYELSRPKPPKTSGLPCEGFQETTEIPIKHILNAPQRT